jgi:hypothetical protein
MIARAIEVHDQTWWRWIAVGWMVILFFAWGPSIERVLFPVISPLKILSLEPEGVGATIYVRFEKQRSCEYLGMNWNRVDDAGIQHRVFLDLKPTEDSSGSTRPVGKFVAGPWYVGMPPDVLQNSSVAVISYRCHPFWITDMKVWP